MNKDELYNKMKRGMESNFLFSEDKPEENIDTTLKALWFKAQGKPISANEAASMPLPAMTGEQTKILKQLIEKRLGNIPLAYLTGRQNFMGIEFLCDNRALIPRKETEILGKRALELSNFIACEKQEVSVFDICCGSGNLGIALAHYNPQVVVHASDLSPDAIALAHENTTFLNHSNRVEVVQGDLFSAFESDDFYGKIDLIVCNPPYISSAKVKNLSTGILGNEPSMAFDGGMLGINIMQRLVLESPKFLTDSGWLVFEVGLGQGEFMMKVCKNSPSFSKVESVPDNTGNIRVICAQKS